LIARTLQAEQDNGEMALGNDFPKCSNHGESGKIFMTAAAVGGKLAALCENPMANAWETAVTAVCI